jgi:MoxR-like ATPase
MAVHLSVTLQRPLLLEGAAGVGKIEIAKKLAALNDTRLIRLQCYEGLDASTTIYEWNYQKQLLSVQAAKGDATSDQLEDRIFSDQYLLKRPLLEAITQSKPPVLLIDEIDRADEEFEAYLLEILSDFQVSIPEIGTITATSHPLVVLTSNGSRDLSDALRRRCLYTYVEYPNAATELKILHKHLPEIDTALAQQIIDFVQLLRKEELEKKPGVAEMLDWTAAIAGLGIAKLSDNPAELQATLVCLLKTQVDQYAMPTEVTQRLVGQVVQ